MGSYMNYWPMLLSWLCNQAFLLSSPAFSGTQTPSSVHFFFYFAWLSERPSQEKGRWETKHFIGMALAISKSQGEYKCPFLSLPWKGSRFKFMWCPPSQRELIVPVILLPLHSVSLTQKNPQRCKIICGILFFYFILLFCHTQWITSKIKTTINRLINIKFEIVHYLGGVTVVRKSLRSQAYEE